MRIIRKSLFVLGLSLIAISSGLAQETCRRHVEPGFSLCVPDGWRIEPEPNQKFKQLFAPSAPTFTANVNVQDDTSTASLPSYLGTSIKKILANPPKIGAASIKLVGWTDFVTATGLNGARLVFETEYKGLLIRTIQYYFQTGQNHRFIVTGTSLVKDKDTFDTIFDWTAKSFRLDN